MKELQRPPHSFPYSIGFDILYAIKCGYTKLTFWNSCYDLNTIIKEYIRNDTN